MDSRLVVFDGDDTLWWTEQLYDEARIGAARLVADCGFDATTWDRIERKLDVENVAKLGLARERFPTSCVEAYEQLAKASGVPVDLHVRSAIWDAADAVFTRAAPLVDGAEAVVREVSGTAKVALLTKGDLAVQRHRLESSGLEELFDRVVVVATKSADDFRSLLRMFSVDQRGAWSIGNSWRSDIEPAVDAGMRAIWIDAHVWEYERHEISLEEHEAVKVAGALREVPEILRSATASA